MSQTTTSTAEAFMGLRFTDVTGQKIVRAPAVPTDSTIAELLSTILSKLGLARSDAKGRSLTYRARLERDGGRYLHGGEVVGDILKADDELMLAPNVDAGRK